MMNERVLIVMPSWVGDVVMATPALRLIRDTIPEAHIAAMFRPGIDALLHGSTLANERLIADTRGFLGPHRAAATIRRAHPFDTALILPNSFSTALAVALAGIPRRIGYARDRRSLLLTERINAPRIKNNWAIIPAVQYYFHAANIMLGKTSVLHAPDLTSLTHAPLDIPPAAVLELGHSDEQKQQAEHLLARAFPHAATPPPFAILNPGGNNQDKRWPPDRFAALADHLADRHNLHILINGSPAESALARHIASRMRKPAVILPDLGITLGSLKPIIAQARIMVTNDTGPRHIAAAYDIPLVSLFGPTDPRWTTIPAKAEIILIANKTLAVAQSANDFPQSSRIDHITLDEVIAAVDQLLCNPK